MHTTGALTGQYPCRIRVIFIKEQVYYASPDWSIPVFGTEYPNTEIVARA